MIGKGFADLATGRFAYLDGKTCFDAWVLCGSTRRASVYLGEHGIKSPRDGNDPPAASVWNAALRYIASNPVAAQKSLGEDYRESWVKKDELWWPWLVKKCWNTLTERQLYLFLSIIVSNPDLEKYLRPVDHKFMSEYEKDTKDTGKVDRTNSNRIVRVE